MKSKVDLVQFGILFFQFLSLVVASPTDQHSNQQVLVPDALLTDFEASPISTLDLVIDCPGKEAIITAEFTWALRLAGITATRFNNDNPYVKVFWPRIFIGKEDWMTYGVEYFKHIVQMGSSNANDKRPYPKDPVPPLKITCNPGTATCGEGNVVAHTDSIKGIINLCDPFWKPELVPNSETVKCEDNKALPRYESKARAILHELTHLKFTPAFKFYGQPADDVKDKSNPPQYAYGVPACVSLAAGNFGVPKVAVPFALENADNWAWIAAGTAWLEICKTVTKNPAFSLPV